MMLTKRASVKIFVISSTSYVLCRFDEVLQTSSFDSQQGGDHFEKMRPGDNMREPSQENLGFQSRTIHVVFRGKLLPKSHKCQKSQQKKHMKSNSVLPYVMNYQSFHAVPNSKSVVIIPIDLMNRRQATSLWRVNSEQHCTYDTDLHARSRLTHLPHCVIQISRLHLLVVYVAMIHTRLH